MEIAYEDILGSVSSVFWESKISVIATYSHCKVVVIGSVSPVFWESKILVIATYSHCKVVVIAGWPYLGYNIGVIHL